MSEGVKGERRAYSTTLRREQAQLTRARILEAARVLFVRRGYPAVTMQEIAAEAAVAYQTVYAQFGSKLRLAIELCDSELLHVAATVQLVAAARGDAGDARFRVLATFTRRLYEPCAEILRFMRESGDAELLGRYREIGRRRLELLNQLGPWGRRAQTLDLVWTFTGPELYTSLVLDRGWSPDDFEAWLGPKLRALVLE